MISSWAVLSVGISLLGLVLLMLGIKKKVRSSRLKENTDVKEERLRKYTKEALVERIDAETKPISKNLFAAQEIATRLRERLEENLISVGKIEAGLTPPTFCHTDSESLKAKIKDIRLKQFEIIKAGQATDAFGNWTWFGSRDKGQQMLTAYRSLLLKAFNAEFDAIRKQMRYATWETAEKKLYNLDDVLANLGETAGCHTSSQYRAYKFRELDTWWKELELKEKKKEERKKQLAILRMQAKEKVPDTEDMEDAISFKYSDLKKAKEIAKTLAGLDAKQAANDIEKLQDQIRALEEKFARATSQAQITRAGYIYVISNIGSFGEGIVKIGMTRRLEPLDRVRELGDASVPYRFDVHALVFVDDAPSLEAALHKHFSSKRVNRENLRKEFFHATAEEVSDVLTRMGVDADWYFEPEAREYYESELIRSARLKTKAIIKKVSESFPEEI